jgi:predicted RNase H-like nuclease (RuvC/YqgF family)
MARKAQAKLKVLATRQEQGKDMGVPVLTRYLGEEIPAWAGEGVNVDEWNKKVAAKYDEMRQEEEEWKKRMQVIIDREKRG